VDAGAAGNLPQMGPHGVGGGRQRLDPIHAAGQRHVAVTVLLEEADGGLECPIDHAGMEGERRSRRRRRQAQPGQHLARAEADLIHSPEGRAIVEAQGGIGGVQPFRLQFPCTAPPQPVKIDPLRGGIIERADRAEHMGQGSLPPLNSRKALAPSWPATADGHRHAAGIEPQRVLPDPGRVASARRVGRRQRRRAPVPAPWRRAGCGAAHPMSLR